MDLDTPTVTRTQTGASNSAPVARKRMSMNFSLPVAVSNGSPLGRKSSTNTPSISAKSPRMNNGELPEIFFRDLKIEDHRDLVTDSARRRDRSLSSASNGHFGHQQHQHQQLHHHTKNNSSTSSTSTNNSGGIFTSSSSHSTASNYNHGLGTTNSAVNKPSFDNYLSELAAKERRVVELKDELKRMQEALKAAERDLKNFRESAVSALGPPVKSAGSSHYTLQTSEAHGRSDSLDNRPLLEEQDQVEVKEESQALISRERAISPDPSHPIKALNMSLYDRGASQLPPTGDVLNMGKRVVEELGTQFWGFFDDIKNAAIGDDVRDHPHRQGANTNVKNRGRMSFQPSEETDDATVTTQPPARELQDLTGRTPSRSRRKSSLNGDENGPMNSYYML